MNILVINCGSSSLKYQLINMQDERVLAQGIVERIGIEGSVLTQKVEGREKYIVKNNLSNHKEAISLVLETLIDSINGVISSMNEISAVGHRVVHGGEYYSKSVLIDEEVKKNIIKCYELAPLHNPANMIGIEACEELMKDTKMVAVFDTAFHQTMKPEAFLYALPYNLYEKDKIRKYGFHGTSYSFVSHKVAEVMGKDIKDLRIIVCHLGNGASVCAIKNGVSVDTTMGFTPLDGIVMGTRSGSIDPAVVLYLINSKGYTAQEIDDLLNKKSGVFGLTGISSDFRDIEKAKEAGDEKAILALDIYHYRIRSQIGAFAAAMGGIDAIAFTAGVGENGPNTRRGCLNGLEFLGIKLDEEANKVRGELKEISTEESKVKVFVVPTNEELVIARETKALI